MLTSCCATGTNIGIAIPSFLEDKQEQGEVLSAFFFGYMATQVAHAMLYGDALDPLMSRLLNLRRSWVGTSRLRSGPSAFC